MTMHPLTANEVSRQRSDEKVARGLAAYEALQRPDASEENVRLRERCWRALSLSLGTALLDARPPTSA